MSGIVTYPLLGRNGRTGNCLFQMATTIAYAIEHNKKFVFPEWDKSKYFKSFIDGPIRNNLELIRETDFSYNELPFIAGDVALEGYFQSEKYFKKHEKIVRHWLQFNNTVTETSNKILKKDRIEQINIAVHLRFGDYVNNPFYADLLATGYYESAFFNFANQKNTYYIFSDDISLAQKEFNRIGIPEKYHGQFFYVTGYSDVEDLCTMSLCDKLIMANSSFSWWGGWLGKQKEIISPKQWFGETAKLDTKDLYTNNMILL